MIGNGSRSVSGASDREKIMDHETSSLLMRRASEGSRDAPDTLFQECGDKLALIRLRLGPNPRAHVESRPSAR